MIAEILVPGTLIGVHACDIRQFLTLLFAAALFVPAYLIMLSYHLFLVLAA